MKTTHIIFTIAILILMFTSCENKPNIEFDPVKSEIEIKTALENLLNSVENRDLETLKAAMSPSGKMELILPRTEVTYTTNEFVEFHEEWFQDTLWTMETKVLNIEPGQFIGTATTEAIYREPNRNGKPYMNHMIVSYVLQKNKDNKWYVIKDHASSLKKTTD